MDFKKVGELILDSVKSAKSKSFTLLPSTSSRPEVPPRAAAAAAVARTLAGLPPHQRLALSSKSGTLASLYACEESDQPETQLEDAYYEEGFDPVKHIVENISLEENETQYLENQISQRLLQLDVVTEKLSHQVMEHHEEMVKGMQLVMELQKDLQVANVICKNGRRNLSSSMHEVSQDLVITANAKRKQFYLDLLPILTQLKHALHMQSLLDSLVEEGHYGKAFQTLAEILQLLERFSELSAVKEMNRTIEAWVSKTLEKLDSVLVHVCRNFSQENYVTVIDAYALIDDISGLVEKLQNVFVQLVLSETHAILTECVFQGMDAQEAEKKSRLTYSDLCLQLPETRLRICLLQTMEVLFDLMGSYHGLMTWRLPEVLAERTVKAEQDQHKAASNRHIQSGNFGNTDVLNNSIDRNLLLSSSGSYFGRSFSCNETTSVKMPDDNSEIDSTAKADLNKKCASDLYVEKKNLEYESQTELPESAHCDLWNELRREAINCVSHALEKGRKNFWQIVSSRIATLFCSDVVSSTSIHQFLQCYESVNKFILVGEAFCGLEAVQFRQKMKTLCESYFWSFHRQNTEGLRMVLEKETWQQISPEAIKRVNLAGLMGNGAALLVSHQHGKYRESTVMTNHHSVQTVRKESGGAFCHWMEKGNPFRHYKTSTTKDSACTFHEMSNFQEDKIANGTIEPKNNRDFNAVDEDEESEDLLADFIDEDSQLPSRVTKCISSKNLKHEEIEGLTGSCVSFLRSMDKYARLMQKLDTVSFEVFKGICQLFEVYLYFIFKTFIQHDISSSNKGSLECLNSRLRSTLLRIIQNMQEQKEKQGGSALSISQGYFNGSLFQFDIAPIGPMHLSTMPHVKFHGLKEHCTSAKSVVWVSEILLRSKAHLQSLLPQSALPSFEDFYAHTVGCVLDLKEQIFKNIAKQLLNISGYIEKIANVKWELKELGMDHNGYVDLLLGEFRHFKTKIENGSISREDQEILLEYGVEVIVETLVEGLSRVKRCTNEGRALMSLDLQVLFNGLQHLATTKIRSKMQMVEAYIKAYYLPETEYIHWARAHPEYTKAQVIGLVNLVASMNNWKRKTRVELIERIEAEN